MKCTVFLAALTTTFFASGVALAADCTTETKKDDLTSEQVQALYSCIKSELREGYASKDGQYAKEYQTWKSAVTSPAAPGFHGKRFLVTYVNETGYDEYVKFSDERGAMPTGTLIAKESFNVSKKGAVQKGPLFFMNKVAAGGDAAEFGDWVFSAIAPSGATMKIKQKFCHDCHVNYEDQDNMGYPVEDVRVGQQ